MQRRSQCVAQYMLTLGNHAMQHRSQGVAKRHANTRKPLYAASVTRCSQLQVKVQGVAKRHANTRKPRDAASVTMCSQIQVKVQGVAK